MVNLTFGEQVKVILSRKGMTIKELAEIIEERTGKKMSRQNLTQRLGRDNFQEQDMRTIADILGCSFQLSILASSDIASQTTVMDHVSPTEEELEKLARKKKRQESMKAKVATKEVEAPVKTPTIRVEEPNATERDMTIGELVEIHEELDALEKPRQTSGNVNSVKELDVENMLDEFMLEPEEVVTAEGVGEEDSMPELVIKATEEPPQVVRPAFESANRHKSKLEEEEDLTIGDVNPYTRHEYATNSVRVHPKRIGYVQVYDRGDHKWTDMTEWAFLGYQERKKALLGKEYEAPIYLD
ncbi:MAG: hypothetical protein RR920_07780 [Lachnospiraceae bacterium]